MPKRVLSVPNSMKWTVRLTVFACCLRPHLVTEVVDHQVVDVILTSHQLNIRQNSTKPTSCCMPSLIHISEGWMILPASSTT